MHMTLAALAACIAHNVQSLASVEANQHSLHLCNAICEEPKMRIRPSWDGQGAGTGEDYDRVYHELVIVPPAAGAPSLCTVCGLLHSHSHSLIDFHTSEHAPSV